MHWHKLKSTFESLLVAEGRGTLCTVRRRGKGADLEVWFLQQILKDFYRKNFLLRSTKSTTAKCLLEIVILLYTTESRLHKPFVFFFLGGRLVVCSQLVSERSAFSFWLENTFTSGAWKDQFGMWFSWTTTVPLGGVFVYRHVHVRIHKHTNTCI